MSKVLKVGEHSMDLKYLAADLWQGSEVLFEGQSSRSIAGPHGSVVTVKDLFHNVSCLTNRQPSKLMSGACPAKGTEGEWHTVDRYGLP